MAAAAPPPSACAEMHAAKAEFLKMSPAYGYGGWLDSNYAHELGNRLNGNRYLDWTGAGQYTTSQITAALSELATTAFGNPHSRNPSSALATAEVAAARALVLQHFNADPSEYCVVWTKGATEGLKLVGECFPWSPASHFIYTQANHKSVLGIGALARSRGAGLHCVTQDEMHAWLTAPDGAGQLLPSAIACSSRSGLHHGGSLPHMQHHPLRAVGVTSRSSSCESMDTAVLCGTPTAACTAAAASPLGAAPPSLLGTAAGAGAGGVGGGVPSGQAPPPPLSGGCCPPCVAHHLVAWPAKDNYEGRLLPLADWVAPIHARSDAANRFFVLLDAAAHAASHPLDLAVVPADFVTVSFYKLFGYPSGLGALLVRREAARHLHKTYFGGGSVDYCTAEGAWAVLSAAPAGLEDGSLAFLSVAALKHGFALIRRLGGMQAVERHVECLRSWTHRQLSALRHGNGAPLLRLFGCHEGGPAVQGGIFQFQVLTADGDRLPGRLVEAAATAAGLHLRTGCNCNPGRCLQNLGIRPEEERARAAKGHTGPVLVVLRPAARALPGGSSDSSGDPEGHQDHHHLVPVPLPLGSVRASLGMLSTFEDVWALVHFLATTFTDFCLRDCDVAAGVKTVSVLDAAQHQVVVRARVSTSSGDGSDLMTAAAAALAETPQTPVASAAAAGLPEPASKARPLLLAPVRSSDSLMSHDGDGGSPGAWSYEI